MSHEVYKLVEWPEAEPFLKHKRSDELLKVVPPNDDLVPRYIVPIDLYVELTRKPDSRWGQQQNLGFPEAPCAVCGFHFCIC